MKTRRLILAPHSPDLVVIGEFLRNRRLEMGVPADFIAQRVGCTGSHIRLIEQGKRSSSLERLCTILEALRVGYERSKVNEIGLVTSEGEWLISYQRERSRRTSGGSDGLVILDWR